MSGAPQFTPAQLAARLGQPEPTADQSAVISAPLEPGVVIAGAGSGKTETMASRVVWLVANGLVRPEEVLGLTFTRKAARELGARVRRRLAQLSARGLIDATAGNLDGEPTVSTYDAYAARIVTEHALRLGREPGARLISEATRWQYADRVVATYGGDMSAVDYAPSTVVGKVMALHGELAGHLVEPEQLRRFATDLRKQIEAVPRAPKQRTKELLYADVAKALSVQDARVALLPIVEEFRRRKHVDGVLDFADQAALAAALADGFPEVGRSERTAYRVVLLDEYQDTSHAQLVLLRALFGGGHPVTAVGDPCQSIYGWRGASAGTLSSFRREFRTATGGLARVDTLSTSFRNGAEVLAVANQVSAPLRAHGLDVPELTACDELPQSRVVAALHLTADDEAADIARRAQAFWEAAPPGRSAAVLVRTRAQIARIETALRALDLPVEVVGVGGLLSTPEVNDIVATLRVLSDPSRGDALMRLLTGSRWRIGARDLDALARWARRLSVRASGLDRGSVPVDADDIDQLSIVDALDALPGPDWFSPVGYRRLVVIAGELRQLRSRVGQSLPELIHEVERMLGLDVEVAARRGPAGRVNLDRFLDVAAEFENSGEITTLSSFLAYLQAAEVAERGLAPGEIEVSGDRIQVLTVHGAKGLEWDAVFVAGLVDKVFPTGGDIDRAWLGDLAELPYVLRGDVDALPRLDLSGVADQQGVRDALVSFMGEAADAGRLEERRLAYVAVTRARSLLVCSGYRWDAGVRPRGVSPFLREIRAACRSGFGEVAVWVDDPGSVNPLTADPPLWQWPYDPLGARRSAIESGAALVRAASDGSRAPQSEWDDEVGRLLEERQRLKSGGPVESVLPDHLSVSQLVLLREDPDKLARALRRPVPRAPSPLARRGTAFHAWLEERWGNHRLLDIDDLPGSADEGGAPDLEITALQEAFLGSEWAQRMPIEIEVPFELMVAGVLLRGRVDAVFAAAGGGIDVVDWKTGRPPVDAADEAVKAVQLAAYRLAFARLNGLPLDRVAAAFHYVRDNHTLRPVDLLDEAALEAVITTVPVDLRARDRDTEDL